jgi:hypothetical protein
MKLTKFLGLVMLGVVLFLVSEKEILAFTVPNIRVVPSNTPTPTVALINKLGNLRLVSTATPTPAIVKLPIKARTLVTLTPTVSPTPSVEEVFITEEPTASPTVSLMLSPTITDQPVAVTTNNMTFWFLIITIGLLAVIIIIQAWPRKDDGE